jgi:hypothetical protein
VQAYVDQTQRRAPIGGDAFVLHTYDVEIQDALVVGPISVLVWGAGERVNSYGITNDPAALLFIPPANARSRWAMCLRRIRFRSPRRLS